jgi:hypothetical protein
MTEHEDKRETDEPDQPDDAHNRSEDDVARKKKTENGIDDSWIDLEPVEEEPSDRAQEDDGEQFTCPNCSAIMPDKDALVCLRCGFDMKSLYVQKTRVGKPVEIDEEEEPDDEEVGTDKPICRSGGGDFWLPGIIGGISAALLIVGYLAGAMGLFPELRAAEQVAQPGFADRMLGLLRFIIIVSLMTGCGISGLWMLALALSRPLGDLALAAARIAAIVAVMRLVTFLNFGNHRQLELIVESVLHAALFVGLSIVAFTIKPRTALMLGGFALMTYLAIWVAARLIVLATW